MRNTVLLTPDDLASDELRDRFLANVRVDEATGCHRWAGALDKDGYGRINLPRPRRQRAAHRVAYALFVGEVPAGMDVEHACHTRDTSCDGTACPHRACVRVDHLEVATHRENVLRGRSFSARQAAQTHCKRGHPLSGPNLYLNGRRRFCRECRNAWARQRRSDNRPYPTGGDQP